MPNTTPHKATLRRYDGENWNPVYLATSADIVQIGEGLTVMGPNHGVYADGEVIPANEAVSTIIKKLIQTQVPPTYLAPEIKLSVSSGNSPGIYEIGDHINVTLESIVKQNDAGEIQAHNITNGETSLADSTTPALSHVIDMDLTEDVVLRSACAYAQGGVKQDNFNEDYPEGMITAGTVTSEPVSYKVFRKTFFGADKMGVTTPLGTSDAVRALPNVMKQFTKDDVLEAELGYGSTRFTIAYPASSGYLRRVEYVEAGNANVLAQFKRTALAVEGANHAVEDLYHVYTLAWDQPISGNMTLRAYCGSDTEPTPPPSRTHEITVDTGNGTSLNITIGITSNDKVIKPEDPVRNNYTFGGWYKDPACTIPWDFENDVFTNDTTIYIKWIPDFVVSVGGDTSGSDVDFVIDPDGKLVEPEDPVKDHHTFEGWYKDPECTIPWDFNDKVTDDVEIYPKWEKITHQVTFNSNSGSAVGTQAVGDGETVTRPSDPTRTGFTFGGWYTDTGCTAIYDFSTPVVSGFTLYAKWTQNIYTVSFNTMNGTFTSDSNYTTNSTTITHGGTIAKPSDPTYEGHTFNGWFTDSNFSNPYNFNNPVSQNLTLYAKWTQITYTVTFDSQGGTTVAAAKVNNGSKVTMPAAPTREGYTFNRWCTSSSGTTAYDFNSIVTSNITIYASWMPIIYTVTFNAQGGSNVSSLTVEHGGRISAPSNPIKPCYNFKGWYTAATGGTLHNFSSAIYKNTTLFAQWEATDDIVFGRRHDNNEPIHWIVAHTTDDGHKILVTRELYMDGIFDAPEFDNTNEQIRAFGYSRWSVSNIRQWLNSDKKAKEWFTPMHEYDVVSPAYEYPGYYHEESGFLYNFSEEEKSFIITRKNETVIPKIDGYNTTEITEDKVWIPSITEYLGRSFSSDLREGAQFDLFNSKENRTLGLTNVKIWTRSVSIESECYNECINNVDCISSSCERARKVRPAIMVSAK